MRSLNWPNLQVIGDNTGFVVKKIYIEYSYLDDERLKFYKDSNEAFNMWRGRGWHTIVRAEAISEEMIDYILQEEGNLGDWSETINEFKQNALRFKELVSKLKEPSFTYEDLLELGEQHVFLELGDFDYYDTCSISLKPSEGRFYWDARSTDDETQIWTGEMQDLSQVNFN